MEKIVRCIKRDLEKVFPDIKFKVEFERSFSASSVIIYYNTPTPLASDVYDVVDKYQAGDYDLFKGEYVYKNLPVNFPQVKYVLVEHV